MSSGAAVFDLDILRDTARSVTESFSRTDAQCRDHLREAAQFLEETQEEERQSRAMLEIARAVEIEKMAVFTALSAELAEAAAEAAFGNLLAIARAAELTPRVAHAEQELEEARAHRERMEQRCEMAERCVSLAEAREAELRFRYDRIMTTMGRSVEEGAHRLADAAESLQAYSDHMPPQARQAVEDWFGWKPKERTPVTPKEVHDRLKVEDPVTDTVLEYLYNTDIGFHVSVDRLRAELRSGADETDVRRKIKQNLVGRLCEEIVIQTFLPMGEKITTQERYTLPDGRYTKVDMILYGLKEPLILGRHVGAQAGGTLAIEVKSGEKAYLMRELEHMLKQAQGHREADISCVVCTRDIKDLSEEQEEKLRDCLREAGSPIYGMLPRKEELDHRCIRFVKAGVPHGI